MRAGVNFAAFDTVKDGFHPFGFVEVFVAPIIVKPKAKD